MSRIFRCAQQSDLWIKARVGRITSSGIGAILASPTTRASTRNGKPYPAGSEAREREEYRREKVIERLYKHAANHHVTREMLEGIEREPFARMLYEAETGQMVEQVGFVLDPVWDWFGCSADGLVGDDGGCELKSPTDGVHDAYAENVQLLIDDYKWQVLCCLKCFPLREWWDLVSFGAYAPDRIKLVMYRFHRSDWLSDIATMTDKAEEFNAQIEAEIARRGFPPTVWDVMP